MEGLTKQQLVLLALLVSFVTSMATGIVTVALMDQAPPGVTQTINRVVQQTVEKVIPATNNSAAVITKETVVRSDEMVVSAVEKNKNNIFKIIKTINYGGVEKDNFGSLAVPINNNYLVTDISVLAKQTDGYGSVIPETYKAVSPDGSSFPIIPAGTDENNNLVFFKQQILSDSDKKITFSPIDIGNSDDLKLGQSIIVMGGGDTSVIGTGIVASLKPNIGKSAADSGAYSSIRTDISFSDSVPGTILLNLSGELVGMVAGNVGGKSYYLPSNAISSAAARIGSLNASSTTP